MFLVGGGGGLQQIHGKTESGVHTNVIILLSTVENINMLMIFPLLLKIRIIRFFFLVLPEHKKMLRVVYVIYCLCFVSNALLISKVYLTLNL